MQLLHGWLVLSELMVQPLLCWEPLDLVPSVVAAEQGVVFVGIRGRRRSAGRCLLQGLGGRVLGRCNKTLGPSLEVEFPRGGLCVLSPLHLLVVVFFPNQDALLLEFSANPCSSNSPSFLKPKPVKN